jgi:membrane dipeptidase
MRQPEPRASRAQERRSCVGFDRAGVGENAIELFDLRRLFPKTRHGWNIMSKLCPVVLRISHRVALERTINMKKQLFVLLSLSLLALSACSTPEPVDVHLEAITIDTHVDIGRDYATAEVDPGIDHPELRCDLTKMQNGGMDGVFLAVYVGNRGDYTEEDFVEAQETAEIKFAAIHRLTEEMYPERCELATRADDVEKIIAKGKRAIMIGIENGFPIAEDLSMVEEYYEQGTRYITMCHSRHNQICDSSSPDEAKYDGFSEFGKKVVAEMNRLGIMCDVSHMSEKSFWDLIEISEAPIIASHSGCAAINPHNRNLTDEQLEALAANGGVIQIVALGSFLKAEDPERTKAVEDIRVELELPTRRELWGMSQDEREKWMPKINEYRERVKALEEIYPSADIEIFADHIDHAVKVAGIDHVGIGTDFDGGGGIQGFSNHAEARNVTDELLSRGYSHDDIEKIWGGNLLRVWRDVEDVAEKLSHPSD